MGACIGENKTVAYKKPRQLTRLLQVTIPREAYVMLGMLIQRRVEKDYAPSKATKSAVMAEAILRLAIQEGLAKEPKEEVEKPPKHKPFEIIPVSQQAQTGE